MPHGLEESTDLQMFQLRNILGDVLRDGLDEGCRLLRLLNHELLLACAAAGNLPALGSQDMGYAYGCIRMGIQLWYTSVGVANHLHIHVTTPV